MKILETQYGKDFVGRDFEVQDLKRKIRNNGVVVLTGNRGIGKTNLMRVLEDFFKQERECHYIESGSLFSIEMSRYFLPEKVDTGASHSISLGVVGGGAGRSWSPREETILEGMEKSDEMIIFVENTHDLEKEDMEIIFAGTGRNSKLKFVLEIARPYYNDADLRISPEQLVELEKLGESDIVKIVEKECPDFTEEVVKRIVSLSDGYPYFARSLAYICEKKESEADMLVFLNTLKDKDMEHTLNSIHKGILATLDMDARELIKKLALAPPVLTLPLIAAFCGVDVDTPLGEVIERGILREDGERYSIYHQLFRDYLQKNQKISLKNKKKIYSEAMEEIKSEPDSFYLLLEGVGEIDIFNELVEIVENYDALNSIGEQSYVWGKISEAALALSRILKVASDAEDKNWISVATGNMGIVYKTQGDMGKALEHYQKALEIHKGIGNKQGMANVLGNMGNVYRMQGDMGKALEHHQKALEIHEEIGDKQGIASNLGNMGLVYHTQGNIENALKHHQKALEIHEEIENEQGIASDLGNMGLVYHTQGNMENALKHHQKALKIHKGIGNKQGIASDYHNLAAIYQTQEDMENALEYYEMSLKFFKEIGNKPNETQILMNIGLIYINKREESIALDYYFDAQEIAQDYALPLLKEINRRINELLAMQ